MDLELDAAAPQSWTVLLVDDEPSVHEMSRLILAGLQFEGRQVELLSAASAAEARALLSDRDDVALALIDVVMETDDAGIALVQHIREQRHDRDMQIVLRTGQPGMAPEGDIVPRYEVNGYFLKTEITAQRLHSIVIAALRNYRHARGLRGAPPSARAPAPDAMREALASELARRAPGEGALLLAQPEIVLASNELSGVELVPQWHTSLGVLPAARIRDALHEASLRRRTVQWMLGQAGLWARSWRDGVGRRVTVSVPLVGECLGDEATLQAVVDTVRDAALERGTLDLLVSEASLLAGCAELPATVQALRAAGVTITLVDFGAHTISLRRLNRVVPDRLKIHRLFVRGVADDPDRMALARSLIALAHTLNIAAIADGIVSDRDAQFFKWEGCELGQGDALAPACTPVEVASYLSQPPRERH